MGDVKLWRGASQIRGYKEHQCRFIFRLADVDLGRLGHVFGLLRMPRMAEIKHAAVALKSFRPSAVDPDTVKACAYTDQSPHECSKSGSADFGAEMRRAALPYHCFGALYKLGA